MSKQTRATRELERERIAFSVRSYRYDPNAGQIGLQAAAALGIDAGRLLKTLMTVADGRAACAVVPSNATLSMKKLAAALGAKSCSMMSVEDAERSSGHVVGGIGPIAQRRSVPTVVDAAALAHDLVLVNAGQRGLQIEVAPSDLIRLIGAKVAAIAA